MSDVVLVYPRTGYDQKDVSVTLPLSVLSVASGLVGELTVRIIDQRVTRSWRDHLERELAYQPLCVGVSAMTGTQILYGLEVSRLVKERAPGVPVVWGGMHATLASDQTLAHPDVDFIIVGEGERVFRDFVRALADRKDYSALEGIGFKTPDGERKINPAADPLDLDKLPPMPYHLVDIEDYVSPAQYLYPGIRRLLPFQGSRGCPYKCTFCSEPALTKKYRMLQPKLFIQQTVEMVDRFRLDHVLYYDEEFFVNAPWAKKVAAGVNRQYTWWAQTRADDLLRLDLAELERQGLYIVAPGLESGSDRVLAFVKKREKVEQFLQANRLLAETGIIPQYNFIIGFPGESEDELNATVDLALQLIQDNPRTVINQFSPFTPLPGTELLEISAREFGFEVPATLEEWIGVSRRRLPTPWAQANKRVMRNLMYTSVFLTTAKRFAQNMPFLPPAVFDLYASLIRRRWAQHRYGDTLDVRLAGLLHRVLSPADFVEVVRGPIPPAQRAAG